MNQTNLDRIQNGTQLFAIDQQPYLQGFLATSLLQPTLLSDRAADEPDPDRTGDRRRFERRADDGRREARHALNASDPECPARPEGRHSIREPTHGAPAQASSDLARKESP